jgi:LysM repeat protein
MYFRPTYLAWILLILISQPILTLAEPDSFTKEQYIEMYKDIAISEMKRTGIPASITLAQGILESAFGNSELAREANNHFGIKCHSSWTGKKTYADDDEKGECFRVYKNATQSYIDHSNFLKNGKRYQFLFEYDVSDYKKWAHGLKQAGYATNPQYAPKLIRLIEELNLTQYDKGFQGHKPDPDKEVFEFNRIMTIMTQEGSTLNDVSKRYAIPVRRIQKYNELTKGQDIEPGTKLFLQPKRRRAESKFHLVRLNETMYAISQEHGIKLKHLYRRNLMAPGTEPKPGTKLYLRGKAKSPPKVHRKTGRKNEKYYKVRTGDTLYKIAKKHGLTVDELKQLNQLEGDDLNPGDRLIISQ